MDTYRDYLALNEIWAAKRRGRCGRELCAAAVAGRRILVTGHTGFKGLARLWLHELEAEVHGFALPPGPGPSLFAEAKIAGLMASHTIGDIRDAERRLPGSPPAARGRLPLGGAAASPKKLPPACRDLGRQCDGNRAPSRRGAPNAERASVSSGDVGQVLRKRGSSLCLSGNRSDGRARPLQQQQGRGRAGGGGMAAFVFLPGPDQRSWGELEQQPGRQRDRRRRLGRRPNHSRLCARPRRANQCQSATQTPCVPGSTFWNRCPDILRWLLGSGMSRRSLRTPLISARLRQAT